VAREKDSHIEIPELASLEIQLQGRQLELRFGSLRRSRCVRRPSLRSLRTLRQLRRREHRYDPNFPTDSAGKAAISPVYTISLEQKPVPIIQGGCFGDAGLLYLSSDGTDLADPNGKKGIYVYHVYGRMAQYIECIRPHMSYSGSKEYEWVDYFDTTKFSQIMPGIAGGNLHLVILDNDNDGTSGHDQDDVNIEHYLVTYN
jgi:hypothetical protein